MPEGPRPVKEELYLFAERCRENLTQKFTHMKGKKRRQLR